MQVSELKAGDRFLFSEREYLVLGNARPAGLVPIVDMTTFITHAIKEDAEVCKL